MSLNVRGLLRAGWACGVCVGDYDNDGRLDLFVANYLDFDFSHPPKPGGNESCMFKTVRVNCGPRGLPTGLHSLFHYNGNGTFTDVIQAAGIANIISRRGIGRMSRMASSKRGFAFSGSFIAISAFGRPRSASASFGCNCSAR